MLDSSRFRASGCCRLSAIGRRLSGSRTTQFTVHSSLVSMFGARFLVFGVRCAPHVPRVWLIPDNRQHPDPWALEPPETWKHHPCDVRRNCWHTSPMVMNPTSDRKHLFAAP